MIERDPVAVALEKLTQICQELESLMGQPLVVKVKEQVDNKPKLSERDVKAIHDLRRRGLKVTEIADIYDCHHSTISRTLRGVYHARP